MRLERLRVILSKAETVRELRLGGSCAWLEMAVLSLDHTDGQNAAAADRVSTCLFRRDFMADHSSTLAFRKIMISLEGGFPWE